MPKVYLKQHFLIFTKSPKKEMNNKVKLKTTKTAAKVAKVQPKAKGSAAASRRLKSKVPIKHVVGVEVKVKDIISKDIEKLHKNPKMELENFIASLVGKGVGETVKFKPKAKQVKVETSKESTISMMSFVSPEKENLGPTAEDSITVPNQAEKGKVDKEKDDEEEEENSFSVVVEKTTEKKEEQAKKSTKEENEEGEATFQVTVEKTDAEVDKTKVATEKTKTKEKQPKMKSKFCFSKT